MQSTRNCGVGVEWSESLEADILINIDEVNCVELIPENFFKGNRDGFLQKLGKLGTPTMVHGVELSIGSAEPLRERHLDQMLRVAELVNTMSISDHLCMTEAGGVEIGQLTPVPFTTECADRISRKIEKIKKKISVPFLIENITNRFLIPYCELTETEFINTILRRTGCEMLLDLNNVHTNATNFGFDAFEWIDRIDLRFVSAIHLAGGVYDDEGSLVDSHSAPVPNQVWRLYEHVCRKITPECTIVEWTDDPPPYELLLADVFRAKEILRLSQPSVLAQASVGAP